MMRANALIVLLFTDLVAATYRFGNYLFAQPVPDMRASLFSTLPTCASQHATSP